ncbi:type I-U CRISPR-associated helicase/endonuclease Cas3 [Lentzea sp. NPDC004782]|uniref:type I-G CRISPR-associated helicase/endonuclease Cas3g n=1 Tax=Lentzea sp. NPDC004782 TaxID=3154458 RepID=UPI0033B29B59
MSLVREDFAAFFDCVHGSQGYKPFAWQWRLLDQVLDTGRWPDRIDAPTGAGKTAVIDVHVFAVALMASGHPVRVPRRLALVVGRRALVDDQYEHARTVARLLADPARPEVLGQVAAALATLRWQGEQGSPLLVGRLRGGIPASRAWRDDPAACAVLCCTPDMWGSRILLRGYGTSRLARPREAGLLAFDSVLVVDEAHLSGQLLTTARRVAALVDVAQVRVGPAGLQVVETTATPGTSTAAGVTVGVEAEDLDHPDDDDGTLARRMRTAKPVRTLSMPVWPVPDTGPKRVAAIQTLADAVLALREEFGPTVGCWVNTVGVAVAVNTELTRRGLNTVLVCGRMRPHDLDRLTHSGVLTAQGDSSTDAIISTQTTEVGADLDLSAGLSELAPGTALAQRAGRVNRRGQRNETAFTIAIPATGVSGKTMSGPYHPDELSRAADWIAGLTDIAPWPLRTTPPPKPYPQRDLLQRLELADTWQLARTNDELFAELDLDLWLAEDFDDDLDVGIVVRADVPADPQDAVALVGALPPRAHEVFPTAIHLARQAVQALLPTRDTLGRVPSVVRVRGEDIYAPDHTDPESTMDIRAGDVFVVDETAAIFQSGVVRPDGRETSTDVLDDHDTPGPGQVVIRIGAGSTLPPNDHTATVLTVIGQAMAEEDTQLAHKAVATVLDGIAYPRPAMLAAAIELLRGKAGQCEVLLYPDTLEEQPPTRVVVRDLRTAVRDERIRQSWTPSHEVRLTDHSTAVATRGKKLAEALGIAPQLHEVLWLAGLHHDDGKIDDRWQRWLGIDLTLDEPLAKSGCTTLTQRRQRRRSGLPLGWRHEQLSVLHCWPHLQHLAAHERDMIARLVGTSHGHGRHSFPHTATELLPPHTTDTGLARWLFDEGGWDTLIEDTHARWGVWGCALLEAVLRAADAQVSGEGS